MGKLIFEYSSMNAGKSTKLLQTAFNYESNDINVLLLKPSIDDRDGEFISSRIGLKNKCFLLNENDSIVSLYSNYIQDNNIKIILVDEAQFLSSSQVYELRNLTIDLDLTIICYGLRTTFQGKPFEASGILLALSDKLVENITICTLCPKEHPSKATMNLKVNSDGSYTKNFNDSIIDTGFEDKYKSVCYKHWYLATI
jgi:thymidine kinase